MTTPDTMNRILQTLLVNFKEACEEAEQSSRVDPRSYSAGWDMGYREALASVIADITGENPITGRS